MKNFSMLAMVFLLSTANGFGQKWTNTQPTKKAFAESIPDFALSKTQDVKYGLCLDVRQSLISQIYATEPQTISISLPGWPVLVFQKADIFTPDFVVKTSAGGSFSGKQFKGVHYVSQSGIDGISFFSDRLMGVITKNNIAYNLGKEEKGSRYLLISELDGPKTEFNCLTQDSDDFAAQGRAAASITASCKITRIALEADFDLYQKSNSSVSTLSNFTSGLFNVVKQIYRKEGVAIQYASLFIWTSVDPYAAMTNTYQILPAFSQNRPKQPSFDFIHLIENRTNSFGGIAFIGQLCGSSPHGVSSIFYTFQQLPLYSWSVNVIAHELGHNFNSRHTHWCGWNKGNNIYGRLDSCFAGESFSPPAGGTSVGCNTTKAYNFSGTIMSYCYNYGAVNLNKGFGKLPGDVIRQHVAQGGCLPIVASPICDSLTTTIVQPPPPPPAQCVTGLQHFTNATGQSCFRFNIQPGCRYTLNYCRYDGYTQANQPPSGATSSACGVRNGLTNYLPTAMQLASGKIELVADGQPSFRQRWYSLRCQGSDGITQLHFFWWP